MPETNNSLYISYNELCKSGANWINNSHIKERIWRHIMIGLKCANIEIPDIYAISTFETLCVNVKMTHGDFIRDINKHKKENSELGRGTYRYYLSPAGTIKANELPNGWGLLEYDTNNKNINVIVDSNEFEYDYRHDLMLICILMRHSGIESCIHDFYGIIN